jgi:hypothetical protein
MKFILAIFLFIATNPARANDFIISHADFVMMNRTQKIQTIKLVQDFLVEYESRQIHNSRQTKKYVHYKKLIQVFIQSAHAEAPLPTDDNMCIYAGNISQMTKEGCANPFNGDNKGPQDFVIVSEDASEGIQFKSAEDGQICNQENELIPCNPKVFGKYYENDNGKEFCVSAKNRGRNATYTCTKALESMSKNPDRYDKAMNYIIDQALQTTDQNDDFFTSMSMMWEICLCGKGTVNGKPDPQYFSYPESRYGEYAKTIFGGRTCAAILGQVQNIKNAAVKACKEAPQRFSSAADRWFIQIQEIMNEIDAKITTSMVQVNATPINEAETIIFGPSADEIYEIATQNNLCPINKPSLTATLNGDIIELDYECNNNIKCAIPDTTKPEPVPETTTPSIADILEYIEPTEGPPGNSQILQNYQFKIKTYPYEPVQIRFYGTISNIPVASNSIEILKPEEPMPSGSEGKEPNTPSLNEADETTIEAPGEEGEEEREPETRVVESCAVSVKQSRSASSSLVAKLNLKASSDEGVNFTWYNMGQSADKKEKKKSKPLNVVVDDSTQSEKSDDSDSNETRIPESIRSTVEATEKKKNIGTSSSVTVTVPSGVSAKPRVFRVIGNRDGVSCGVNTVTVNPLPPDNSNPMQINPGPGYGPQGPKTFREGI